MEKFTAPPRVRGKFGLTQFAKHPPKWVVPAVALSVLLLTSISVIVQGDPLIPEPIKHRVDYYCDAIIGLIVLIAPFFGISLRK